MRSDLSQKTSKDLFVIWQPAMWYWSFQLEAVEGGTVGRSLYLRRYQDLISNELNHLDSIYYRQRICIATRRYPYESLSACADFTWRISVTWAWCCFIIFTGSCFALIILFGSKTDPEEESIIWLVSVPPQYLWEELLVYIWMRSHT